MKQNHFIWLVAVLSAALTACVHHYPTMTEDGEEGVDPTLVQVETEMELDLTLVPLEINAVQAASPRDAPQWQRRFVIDAYRRGETTRAARQVVVVDEADNADGKLTVPLKLKLHALNYTLAVWTDYVKASTQDDCYYTTDDLQQVACTDPYTGSTDRRDCLYGTTELDLTPYRDEWNAKVQIEIELVRPLAKYEIIATDVKDFLRKTKKRRADGNDNYTITFSYGFYLPTVFNALTGKPADSQTGVQYTTPLTVPDDGREECSLGTDFVFVNGTESFVVLTMEIRDETGEVISRTTGLQVPYRRGHLTTVRARFLTNEMQGGVDIDPGYDGDIDVDLDKLH